MKTLRISQISVPLKHSREQVIKKALRLSGIKPGEVISVSIVRRSVDARKKNEIHYSYTVDVKVPDKFSGNRSSKVQLVEPVIYKVPEKRAFENKGRVSVVGAGPAGLFAAYVLALSGAAPVVFERGASVEERVKDVEEFWERGVLNPESNVQFGEGGAGTFSDGKLNTLVKDKYGRNRFVLETFVKFGAPEEILYESKPHVGTDVLSLIVSSMRKEIISLGGQFRFHSKVTGFSVEEGQLKGLWINGEEFFETENCVLAAGHSARDTFEVIKNLGAAMEAKSFAVGLRVEHPQEMIDVSQYGRSSVGTPLPVSPYKVTHKAGNGRGVYSFCMCPGGYVVNASSEPGRLCVNGMSYSGRNSRNANSAIIVTVDPGDFGGEGPLAGVEFQRRLEKKAYELCKGKIPQQLYGDFMCNRTSRDYGEFESCFKGKAAFGNLRELFDDSISEAFCEGMEAFGRKIKGFDRADAILSGIESRTSSPVRILRDESYQSNISGIFPCGEGAGYAGGITSAAMDGIKVAEGVIEKLIR